MPADYHGGHKLLIAPAKICHELGQSLAVHRWSFWSHPAPASAAFICQSFRARRQPRLEVDHGPLQVGQLLDAVTQTVATSLSGFLQRLYFLPKQILSGAVLTNSSSVEV